jgi:hypothetical protein
MILDGWGKSPTVSAIDNIMYLLLTAFIKITQVLNGTDGLHVETPEGQMETVK